MTACQFIINWGTAVPVLSFMGTIVAALRAGTPPSSPFVVIENWRDALRRDAHLSEIHNWPVCEHHSKQNEFAWIYGIKIFLRLISPNLDLFSLLDWCSVVSLIVAYFWS